jgi:hypothetical protein
LTTSADVPGLLPCAIHGHPYLCESNYQRQTVPVMRQQADTSTEAGEQSLNPQGLWRRSQESWHHGAGQDFLDGRMGETPPDPHRFRSSKGVDCWTKGQISLLRPTLKAWSTANTNLHLAVAQFPNGSFRLYVADGNALYFSALPYSLLNTLALQQGTGWSATNATIGTPGIFTFRLTATSAAAVSATSPTGVSGFSVEAGRRYGFRLVSTYVSGGAPRIPQVNVTWYTAAGATISSSTPVAAASDDTSAVIVSDDEIAPATAAFASATISYTANWASGEIHQVELSFGPYDVTSTLGSPSSWETSDIQAGEAAQAIQSIASNGSYVWAALGTSGLHRTSAGSDTSTANVPAAPAGGQISLVGYAAPFLLAAGSAGVSATRRNTLWLVTDPLGTPALSVIKTHDNTNFTWEGIASGRNCVYAWGNSGGTGEIYKIMFDPNTGSLSTAASPATSWVDGETIHSLVYYAGAVILGTGKGVRIGTIDGGGNIDFGPLIKTDWPVRCLEPQDRYCWFGWTKYDATNSGLGRIDLGFLTDTLTPAWASDLMTVDDSTGDVVAAVTFAPYGYTANQRPPVRVFTVAGEGVYIEDPGSRVESGGLYTGMFRYSTSEPKSMRAVDVRHHVLPAPASGDAGVVVNLLRDNNLSLMLLLGVSSVTGSYGATLPAANSIGEAFELLFTLEQPDNLGTDYSRSPEMTRWTAKALPLPSTIDEVFVLTLQMKEYILTSSGKKKYQDVPAEVTFLKGLERARTIVDFQVGSETHEGYVAATEWAGTNWNNPKREFAEGTLQVTLMTARG